MFVTNIFPVYRNHTDCRVNHLLFYYQSASYSQMLIQPVHVKPASTDSYSKCRNQPKPLSRFPPRASVRPWDSWAPVPHSYVRQHWDLQTQTKLCEAAGLVQRGQSEDVRCLHCIAALQPKWAVQTLQSLQKKNSIFGKFWIFFSPFSTLRILLQDWPCKFYLQRGILLDLS